MSTLIFTCWGLAIAAQFGLLSILVRRRIAFFYWGVTAWATVGVGSGLHLVYTYMQYGVYPWRQWQPFTLAAMILLTADVAHKLARHWPARTFGWVVNGIFAALSLAAMAWVARIIPSAPWGADAAMVKLSEHFSLACATTIGLNWMVYSIPLDSWRRNARLHVRAALSLTGACGLAYFLAAANKSTASIAVANLTLTIAPIVASVGWARMSRGGESYRMQRPHDGLLEALEGIDRKRLDR